MSLPVIVLMVMGLICIVYGVLVLMIGSGTLFFAVWFVMGGGLMAIALLIRIRFFERIPKPLLLFFAGILITGCLFMVSLEAYVLKEVHSDLPGNLPYIFVLGAQVRENGPSKVLAYRLDAAAGYMHENPETVCIVSGGKGYNEPTTEGSAMKQYLIRQGIDENRIFVEEEAVNTVQNIQFSKAFLPSYDVPVGIVTNNFHVARAKALARAQGLTNVYGLAAPSDPIFLPNNMFRECFGLVKDYLAGNL